MWLGYKIIYIHHEGNELKLELLYFSTLVIHMNIADMRHILLTSVVFMLAWGAVLLEDNTLDDTSDDSCFCQVNIIESKLLLIVESNL